MAAFVLRTLGELGEAVTLAPERARAAAMGAHGVMLGELCRERTERTSAHQARGAVVLDTTHACDGWLDVAAAMRAGEPARSAKKRVRPGDLLVSRLRPYLRQVAFAHPAAFAALGARPLVCSPEFFVLSPRGSDPGSDLAYLVPFLLGPEAQAVLAAGQEGGHHPRVPRDTLFALRVPRIWVEARVRTGARVRKALRGVYAALGAWQQLLSE